MRAWIWLVGVLVLAGAMAWAAQKQEDKQPKEPADLAWVPAKAAVVVSVRLADLWDGELGKRIRGKIKDEVTFLESGIEQEAGLPPAQVERFTVVMRDPRGVPLFFVRSTKALDKDKFLKRIIPGGETKKVGAYTFVAAALKAAMLLGEREYVIGTPGDIETLIEQKGEKAKFVLAPAIALAAKGHTVVAGVHTAGLVKPEDDLPADLEPYRALLKSQYVTLAANVGAKTAGSVRVVFEKADDAKEGEKALEKARETGLSFLEELVKPMEKDGKDGPRALGQILTQARAALKAGKLARDDKELTAAVEVKIDAEKASVAGLMLGQKMREAASRMMSANNLKQLGLAMHNYHDKDNAFPPPAVFDKNGKALLSWRVLMLPYIGQQELYDQFKLDEPWDSKHNKKLLEKMPALFRSPVGKPKEGMTCYVGLVGKSAFFEGKRGNAIASITDGTSNTIMLVETDKQIPWTKPEDLPFDPDKELPKIGGLFEGGFNAGFCDGSVRFIQKDINKDTLKALITRDGGEVIGNID